MKKKFFLTPAYEKCYYLSVKREHLQERNYHENQITAQQEAQLTALADLLTALGGECKFFFEENCYGITIENYADGDGDPLDLILHYSDGKLATDY